MQTQTKYVIYILLAAAAVAFFLNHRVPQLPGPGIERQAAQGRTAPMAGPAEEQYQAGGPRAAQAPGKPLEGIDDKRIKKDREKFRKAQSEAVSGEAEALKKAEAEEKKAQLELAKIAREKAAAAKEQKPR